MYRSKWGAITLLVSAVFSFAACASGSGDDSSPDTSGSKDYVDILTTLGVKEVTNPPDLELTVAIDGDETNTETLTIEDPDIWTPLKHTYAVFNPTSELMLLGAIRGGYYNTLFDDGKNSSYTRSHPDTGDQAWLSSTTKRACAADINGDGIEEVVILYTTSTNATSFLMRTYKLNSSGVGAFTSAIAVSGVTASSYIDDALNIKDTTTTALTVGGLTRNPYGKPFSLTAADLDGDGKDEVLLVNGQNVTALSVSSSGTAVTVLDSIDYSNKVMDLSSGDCDGDGKDEFLVSVLKIGTMLYNPTSGSVFTEAFNTGFAIIDSDMVSAETCFGDFDGDGDDDYCVVQITNTRVDAYTYTYSESKPFNKKNLIWSNNVGVKLDYRACPRAVDVDGDGVDELYFAGYICTKALGASGGNSVGIHPALSNFYSLDDVQVGDVDGDGCEDLVLCGKTDQGITDNVAYYRPAVTSLGCTSTKTWNSLTTKYAYVADTDTVNQTFGNAWNRNAVVVANMDKDSARVKYTGHELKFTSPIVVAALASPPFFSEIAGNESTYSPNDWSTTFSQSSSTSGSSSVTAGLSVGVEVGYSQDIEVFGITIAEFELSASFKSSCSYGFSSSTSVTKDITYSSQGGENRVVFTSIPMDIYSYEILDSPTASDVGTTMEIKIPRDFNFYSTDVDFYNANNSGSPDIDSTIFAHTIGDPFSYPSKTEKTSLVGTTGYSSEALPVSQYDPKDGTNSGGTIELGITVESAEEHSFEYEYEYELSAGGGVGGFSASISAGFTAGYSYTIGTTSGTGFSGTVGNLPTAYYSDAKYSYESGLFAYHHEDENGQSFWVVDYWVE